MNALSCKRQYKSQHDQVEHALSSQDEMKELLQKILDYVRMIYDEIKEQRKDTQGE